MSEKALMHKSRKLRSEEPRYARLHPRLDSMILRKRFDNSIASDNLIQQMRSLISLIRMTLGEL